MASPEATTRTNHDQMTPESTPGPDADRLAADKERQKTQAAPTSHGLATPDATPEPDELHIQADKARQQQAEHAEPKEAPSTQSKPPFDAESASEPQQGSEPVRWRDPSQENTVRQRSQRARLGPTGSRCSVAQATNRSQGPQGARRWSNPRHELSRLTESIR